MPLDERQQRIGEVLQERHLLQREVAMRRRAMQRDHVAAIRLARHEMTLESRARLAQRHHAAAVAPPRGRVDVNQLTVTGAHDPVQQRMPGRVPLDLRRGRHHPRIVAGGAGRAERLHVDDLAFRFVERPFADSGDRERNRLGQQRVHVGCEPLASRARNYLSELREDFDHLTLLVLRA
nr:hypothetical protein [Burkholderia ubonensis]